MWPTYYHHETVYVGGKEDDICNNIRKGLDIQTANYKLDHTMPPASKNWNEQQENKSKHRCHWAGEEVFFL